MTETSAATEAPAEPVLALPDLVHHCMGLPAAAAVRRVWFSSAEAKWSVRS